LILKALQTLDAEPLSSPSDAVGRAVKSRCDVDVLHPLGGVQHNPRALHHAPRQRYRRRSSLELDTLGF
jgi:hypothetical protein